LWNLKVHILFTSLPLVASEQDESSLPHISPYLFLNSNAERIFTLLTGSMALHFTANIAHGCEAHTDFASESVYLMADNVWNKMKQLTCKPLNDIMFYSEQ
jgi:hypothetical protein